MKVSSIHLRNFKRFSNLSIKGIPRSTKLVIVVGPNGSGKSSLFDAFNHYYRNRSGFIIDTDEKYFRKLSSEQFDWQKAVVVKFHDYPDDQQLPKNSMYFRTAYRNDPDFNISNFTRIGARHEKLRIKRFIDNDQAVSLNY
ncbi:AAA family ATPase [Melioribacter sp. Ez-97]|uniref:AAA family ATPase n=1 Tax=Melioribacter sp. Ez-97 TaxID=3423434 RepID=UPI003EDA438C